MLRRGVSESNINTDIWEARSQEKAQTICRKHFIREEIVVAEKLGKVEKERYSR